jgi:L-2-hydroxyglutarate oxidase LhgO
MVVDFLIVGAGIMGLSIARELLRRYPGTRLAVIEKENEVAFHASGRNSGVLHAGFYYTADSLKARLTRTGNRELTAYCLENGLPLNPCGKVVVAAAEEDVEGLFELKRRGEHNGVELQLIDERQLKDIEPNARTTRYALFSPTTSSVNPGAVCRHIAGAFPATARILFRHRFLGRAKDGVRTSGGTIHCRHLFNAAGLYADKVARHYGAGAGFTMIPFKGIYLRYGSDDLIRRHIYPVPNLRNPFLGVHFTVTVDGHIKIGPTAIPAFWRENYTAGSRFDLLEFVEIIGREAGLFLGNHFNFRSLAFEEIRKYNRAFFIAQARRLVHRLDAAGFGDYTRPGIRAQLLNTRTKALVMDFVVEQAENSTHVLNAVSPAFTSAFSFARHVVDESAEQVP